MDVFSMEQTAFEPKCLPGQCSSHPIYLYMAKSKAGLNPVRSEWANFIVASAWIDGYGTNEVELVQGRNGGGKPVAGALANCANKCIDFSRRQSGSIMELAHSIASGMADASVREGWTGAGVASAVVKTTHPQVTIGDATWLIENWAAEVDKIDDRIFNTLSRGWVIHADAQQGAWLALNGAYLMEWAKPWSLWSGTTGRFCWAALRKRWGMPLREWDREPEPHGRNFARFASAARGSSQPWNVRWSHQPPPPDERDVNFVPHIAAQPSERPL
jgi:hypothetical protein